MEMAAPYRFVHTADIHLDSPLKSLALRDPELAQLIGNATRKSFVRTIDLCIEEAIDALLIAGDLYDGDQTSMKTALFLAEQLERLHQHGIGAFIVRGNHDAESRITRELVFRGGVKVFSSVADVDFPKRPEGSLPVAIHGLSFAKPHAPESLLKKYKVPLDRHVNIGIMHTSLSGAVGHNPYAPCSPEDLNASQFDYWALGHIHKRSVITGKVVIVMPGNPQGRDINESGPKSVSLVTIGNDRTINVAERFTALAQFETVRVDASTFSEWNDLVHAITGALESAREDVQADHLVARLRIEGNTPLAWRIRSDHDLLLTEAKFRASSIGNCWVEKVDVACSLAATPTTNGDADPVAELRNLIGTEILGSDAFKLQLVGIGDELRSQLPAECREVLGKDQAEYEALLSEIAREGAEDVLARISAERSGK
jgi:DNA repair exonuclease SbcCD nuclease subunit